jgi:hypothetical protein
MTPEEFQSIYPHVVAWIRQTLAAHANKAQTVASRGFTRLPLYFSGELLASTKFVTLERLPMPPLSALGLSRFAQFERGDFDGITYLDTFYVVEFRTAEGKKLAITVPRTKAAVLKHFQAATAELHTPIPDESARMPQILLK